MLNLSQYLQADEKQITEPVYPIALWHYTAMERLVVFDKLVKVQSKRKDRGLFF